MPNPFDGLRLALELICREGKVLPATGQAVEEFVRPDHEEVIDGLRMGEDKYLDVIIEAPNRKVYVELAPLHRTERHLFRYFLDGSARTFFLGDVVVGTRRSPIYVSQIGAAAVFREDDGRVHLAREGLVHRIVLMMNMRDLSFGEQVKQLVDAGWPRYKFVDLMEDDGETEQTSAGKDPRSRAAHKAHHLMAREEDELGRSLPRKDGEWLVLDGSLGKDLHKWRDVPNFIGVTKSFSREPTFKLAGSRKTVNLYELLAGLPFSARTCAFAARSGQVAVWYVRLREQRQLDYPLMGVVKVEYPNPSCDTVPSELIDEISAALIAERLVTPHGKDARWHAHLYPIFLAEQAIKNRFVSTEALKAGLRWPSYVAQSQV